MRTNETKHRVFSAVAHDAGINIRNSLEMGSIAAADQLSINGITDSEITSLKKEMKKR